MVIGWMLYGAIWSTNYLLWVKLVLLLCNFIPSIKTVLPYGSLFFIKYFMIHFLLFILPIEMSIFFFYYSELISSYFYHSFILWSCTIFTGDNQAKFLSSSSTDCYFHFVCFTFLKKVCNNFWKLYCDMSC